LGTMFILVTVVAVWLGWELTFIRERQVFIKTLRDGGGQCLIASDPEFLKTGLATPTIPFWRRWLGDEAVALVVPRDLMTEADEGKTRKFFKRARRLFPESHDLLRGPLDGI
jgi:hypothetical protein